MIDYIIGHTDTELINGLEGKKLLSALTAFVKVAMLAPLEAHIQRGKVL